MRCVEVTSSDRRLQVSERSKRGATGASTLFSPVVGVLGWTSGYSNWVRVCGNGGKATVDCM